MRPHPPLNPCPFFWPATGDVSFVQPGKLRLAGLSKLPRVLRIQGRDGNQSVSSDSQTQGLSPLGTEFPSWKWMRASHLLSMTTAGPAVSVPLATSVPCQPALSYFPPKHASPSYSLPMLLFILCTVFILSTRMSAL